MLIKTLDNPGVFYFVMGRIVLVMYPLNRGNESAQCKCNPV